MRIARLILNWFLSVAVDANPYAGPALSTSIGFGVRFQFLGWRAVVKGLMELALVRKGMGGLVVTVDADNDTTPVAGTPKGW